MKGIKSRTGSGDFVPLVVWSFQHMCLPQGFCVSVSNFQKSKWLLVHLWFLAFSGLLMRAAWIPCYTGLTQLTTADTEQFLRPMMMHITDACGWSDPFILLFDQVILTLVPESTPQWLLLHHEEAD